MLYDSEITSAQMTIAEVARRVPCSRVAIYENNMAPMIRIAQEKKMKSVDYSAKLARARKPKLIKMQDRNRELTEELKIKDLRIEKLEKLFYRLLINVMTNSTRLDIKKDLDDLLTKPVEPLAFKRYLPFAQRKKEDYLERLIKLRSISQPNNRGI
jgi:hypothetical protein